MTTKEKRNISYIAGQFEEGIHLLHQFNNGKRLPPLAVANVIQIIVGSYLRGKGITSIYRMKLREEWIQVFTRTVTEIRNEINTRAYLYPNSKGVIERANIDILLKERELLENPSSRNRSIDSDEIQMMRYIQEQRKIGNI